MNTRLQALVRPACALVLSSSMMVGCGPSADSGEPESPSPQEAREAQPETPDWRCTAWQEAGPATEASMRGLSAAGEEVWISGTGSFISRRSEDQWHEIPSPTTDELDFRDVDAFPGGVAYLMSAGPGEASRIFKTVDGGETWTLQFTNPHTEGFLDGMAFWDEARGLAYGDPVGGMFFILRTEDGGATWNRAEDLPPALEGEAGFAASGTGLAVGPDGHAWFGTGGPAARVFRSADYGRTWQVSETPMASGEPSTGVFSLAFVDAEHGVAVGGDYQKPDEVTGNAAWTEDGGITWNLVSTPPSGYRSAVAYVPGSEGRHLITVGTSGTDISLDGGRTWERTADGAYNAVAFGEDPCSGWSVGPDGRVARLDPAP